MNFEIKLIDKPLIINKEKMVDNIVYYDNTIPTDLFGIINVAIKNNNTIFTSGNNSIIKVKVARGVKEGDYLSTSPFKGRLMSTSIVDGTRPFDAIAKALTTDYSFMGEVDAILF